MTALQRQLLELESSGLVALAQAQPTLEYMFRHALVQEAAYESLLHEDRRALHQAVGEALEQAYPERLDELAPLLGRHFHAAGDDTRALVYLTRAAAMSAARYANAEAASHYSLAIEVGRRLAAPARDITRLYLGKGRALELAGRYPEALATYEELEALACERSDPTMEMGALTARLTVYAAPTAAHDPGRGAALAEQVLRRARELGDGEAEGRALWSRMLLCRSTGEFAEGLRLGAEGLLIAEQLGLVELAAYIQHDLSGMYLVSGQIADALDSREGAEQRWRALGNQPMLIDSLAGRAYLCYFGGRLDETIALAEEADRLAERTGNLWGRSYCRMSTGPLYRDRGETGHGIAVMEECIALADEAGFTIPRINTRAELALAYGYLGDLARGMDLARKAGEDSAGFAAQWRAWSFGAVARLQILAGDLAAAEATVHQMRDMQREVHASGFLEYALGLAECWVAVAAGDGQRAVVAADTLMNRLQQRGVRIGLAETLATRGRGLLLLGRTEEGRAALEAARVEAEALGLRHVWWPILLDLARIAEESHLEDRARASALRQQAREIVTFIADHAGSASLRGSYLALPEVALALEVAEGRPGDGGA